VLKIVHTDGPERTFIPVLRISATPQPGQPLLGILNFGQAWVGVLPEVEEFAVAIAGLSYSSYLLTDSR